MATEQTPTTTAKPSLSFAQLGAREHYALMRAAHGEGRLAGLYTDFWAPDWLWCEPMRKLAPRAATRCHVDVPSQHAKQPPWFGTVLARARRRTANGSEYTHYLEDGAAFGCWVRRQLEHSGHEAQADAQADAHFLFNTGALEALEWLRRRGHFAIVGQIDPARTEHELVCQEHADWPDWAPRPEAVPEAYWQRLAGEWELATLVAVNSPWCAEALVKQGVPPEKLTIVPLAYEHSLARTPAHAVSADVSRSTKGPGSSTPLTVLFLGQVGLRKGVHYLLQAAAQLLHLPIQIVIVGPISLHDARVRGAPPNVQFRGAVPRSAVAAIYAQADVFVLPILSDGFALTQLEAMAHGLPVIATSACGAVVQPGVSGFQIPCRDVPALVDALGECEQDRLRLSEMSMAARKRAAQFTLARPLHLLDAAWARHQHEAVARV